MTLQGRIATGAVSFVFVVVFVFGFVFGLFSMTACTATSPLENRGDGSATSDAAASVPDLAIRDAAVPDDAIRSDARAPTDGPSDGPSIDRDAGTFPCGPKLQCKLGSEYCYSSNFGDAGMSEWFCAPLQNCDKGDRCKCLLLQHQCFAACRDDGGPIYFWCPR